MWRLLSIISLFTGLVYSAITNSKKRWIDSKDIQSIGNGYYSTRKYKGRIIRIFYGIEYNSNVSIIFKRENLFDKLLKLAGLCKEFETGDDSFDSKVFVVSDDHKAMLNLSANESLRDLIISILYQTKLVEDSDSIETKLSLADTDIRFKVLSITLAKGVIWVEIGGGKLDEFDSSVADRLSTKLRKIAGEYKALTSPISTKNYSIYRILQGVQSGFLIFIGSYFLLSNFIESIFDTASLVSYGFTIKYSIIAVICYLLLFSVISTIYLKRSPFLPIVLRDLFIIGTFSASLSMPVLIRALNIGMDTSIGEKQVVRVIDKHCSRRSKHIEVIDWRDPCKSLDFNVGTTVYSNCQIGSTIELKVHNGFFKDPWVNYK